MGLVTLGFGLALMALGFSAWALTGFAPEARTALIPGYFGIPLCILGFIAVWNDSLRKHVMHGAVVVSLIGFLIPAFLALRQIPAALTTGGFHRADGTDSTRAFITQLLMALLCAAHVGLCVKSFLDARRRRKQASSTPDGQLTS